MHVFELFEGRVEVGLVGWGGVCGGMGRLGRVRVGECIGRGRVRVGWGRVGWVG